MIKESTKYPPHNSLGLIFLLFPLSRIIIIIVLSYYFGIIKSILSCVFLYYVYIYYMQIVHKHYPISLCDTTFVYERPQDSFTCCVLIKLKNIIDVNEFKKSFIERGIKNFPRLNMIRVTKNYEFWWKLLTNKETINMLKFKEYSSNNTIINNKKDLDDIMQKEINLPLKVDYQLPYEFHFYNNPDNKHGYFICCKFDHAFTDGLGCLSLILGLADNYSEKLFPFNKKISYIQYILSIILMPYYILRLVYLQLSLLFNYCNSPFKSGKDKDEKHNGFRLATIDNLKFSDASQIYKKLGVSYNDLCLSILSKSANRIVKEHNKDNINYKHNQFVVGCPVGLRGFPKKLKDLEIKNDSMGMILRLRVVEDVISECKLVSKEFKASLKDLGAISAAKFVIFILIMFFPVKLFKLVAASSSKDTDFMFSNVPGPKEKLFYNGNECDNLCPYLSSGFYSTFTACFTYNGIINFIFSYSNSLLIEPELFKSYFIEEFDYLKQKLS